MEPTYCVFSMRIMFPALPSKCSGAIAKENQWGEPNPLDMDENLVHEETAFVKSDTISA